MPCSLNRNELLLLVSCFSSSDVVVVVVVAEKPHRVFCFDGRAFGGSAVSRRHRPPVSRVVLGALVVYMATGLVGRTSAVKEMECLGFLRSGFVATSRSPSVGAFWAQDRFLFRAERR